jgi:hypothetical protein
VPGPARTGSFCVVDLLALNKSIVPNFETRPALVNFYE